MTEPTPQSIRNLPAGRMVDIKRQFEIAQDKRDGISGKELLTSPNKKRNLNPFMLMDTNRKLKPMEENSNSNRSNVQSPTQLSEAHKVYTVPCIPMKTSSPQVLDIKTENSVMPVAPLRKKRLSGSDGERTSTEGDNVTYSVVYKNRNKKLETCEHIGERGEVAQNSVTPRLKLFQIDTTENDANKTDVSNRTGCESPMSKSERDVMVSNINDLMTKSLTPVNTPGQSANIMTKSHDSYDRLNFSPTPRGGHVVIQRNKNSQTDRSGQPQPYALLQQEPENVQHLLVKRTDTLERPQLPARPTTPAPPKKPPRTHAHEQYLETKQIIQTMILPPGYSAAKPIDLYDTAGESKKSGGESKQSGGGVKPLKPPKWNTALKKDTQQRNNELDHTGPRRSPKGGVKRDVSVEEKDSAPVKLVFVNPVTGYTKISTSKSTGITNESASSTSLGAPKVSITRGVPVSSRPDKPKRPPPPRPRSTSLVSAVAVNNVERQRTPPSRHSSFQNNPLYEPMQELRYLTQPGAGLDTNNQTEPKLPARRAESIDSSSQADKTNELVQISERSADFKIAQRKISDAIELEASVENRLRGNGDGYPSAVSTSEKMSAVSQMEQKKLPKLEAPVKTLHILPRQVQIMLWRSCSDEYLYSSDFKANSPVYMDPTDSCMDRVTSLDDTYASADIEVYMDTDGYAIPYRFKKTRLSPRHSDNPIGFSDKGKLKDRMRGLFRLVSLTESREDSNENETPKSRKRKLTLVKHKINSAFSILRGYVKKRPSLSDDLFDPVQDVNATDADSLLDQREIQQRLEYVSSVRDKTHARIRSARLFEDNIYPQLFECALIVGLQRTKSGTLGWQPEILHKFPELRSNVTTVETRLNMCSVMVNINETIPQFCFPDSEFINPRTVNKKSETYSFVLTNEEGGRVYGYCRRYVVHKLGWKTVEVICIISPLNSFNLYKTLLDEIEKRRLISLDQAQELVASSFGRPLPSPGRSVNIRSMNEAGDMETVVLARNMDTRLDNVDYDLLFSVLGVDKLIRTFSSMLLERRLLFTSTKLSLLSATIHALASLLYPFSWQHTYIPVLPPKLLEITCTPTPYVIGILHSELDKVTQLPTEEILIIDLDTKSLLESMGDENTILPKKLFKALKSALNMCRVDAEAERSKNLMISEAFIRLFVEIVGHYGDFMFTQQDGETTFEKDEFVASTKSESVRQFLTWFVDTQMFEVFIVDQTRANKSLDIDLFTTRISEYKEEIELTNSKSGKRLGKKFLNFGKAIRTKLT